MKNNRKKVYIETLGCQMNKSDSEKILGILETLNYYQTSNHKEADLLIINTCTIRASAEDKAFSYLGVWGKMKKTKPDIKIAICGCVAQQRKEEILKRAPYVDIIFGTHNIDELPELIKKQESKHTSQCSILKTPYQGTRKDFTAVRDNTITAWVNIIEGCDYFCTYCVVPYVRGRQRSRPFDEIVQEVEKLANQGYKEVTLLGQTVDSYGNDINDNNVNLPALLKRLNKISNLYRIRFVTSHPKDITDDLIDTVAELDKVCEYFHIPMQSGNTEILKKMKRGYTSEEYYTLVNKIKNKINDVAITSDFIVAFPGETEEQFYDTVKAINDLGFDQCNTAMYSPRKQTPAATWKDKQLPVSIKKERINILNSHVKEAALKASLKYQNTIQEVLVESYTKKENGFILNGRTRNNKLTHFKGEKELTGQTVKIFVEEASPWSLKGRLI
jgi:tRNA-2-methylthio-N6-dimethylallyladenosine synthase